MSGRYGGSAINLAGAGPFLKRGETVDRKEGGGDFDWLAGVAVRACVCVCVCVSNAERRTVSGRVPTCDIYPTVHTPSTPTVEQSVHASMYQMSRGYLYSEP